MRENVKEAVVLAGIMATGYVVLLGGMRELVRMKREDRQRLGGGLNLP